ncbi:MAG: VWA domain-containing protein, partial [Hyphomicrobiales bacterium]|nr:VWA domain-containing protein [Hyphomicrobiales bacterium]
MNTSSANPDGRIADNIVYFARALRKAGMRVGPASVKDAIEAVLVAGIGSRDDFYWTLHAVLVTRHEDHPVFDEAFRLFWKSRELIEKMIAMFSPVAPDHREKQKPRAAENRVSQAMFEGHQKSQPQKEIPEIEVDARLTVSGNEVLRAKDFAQMTAAELGHAKKAIQDLRLPFDSVVTRRFKPDPRGRRADPRAMMRSAVRTGGQLILPKFRSPREVHPPLVVLADISGSMSQYTRIFLHFLHALTEKRRRVHTFVFGTRLTNLTRQMRHRDPDQALAECAGAVKDWSGGTRIGDTLNEFNRLWSRRVLGQGAVVLLITDGLERDDVTGLAEEMERLRKSCRRLIWL